MTDRQRLERDLAILEGASKRLQDYFDRTGHAYPQASRECIDYVAASGGTIRGGCA